MLRQIEQYLTRGIWTAPIEAVPVWKRIWLRALRLLVSVWVEFRHRLLDARATALVYTTLLSLVPLLAIVVSILKMFGVHDYMEQILDQALQPLGPSAHEVSSFVTQFVNQVDVRVLGLAGTAGVLYTTYSLLEQIEDTLNAIWRVRRGRSWVRKMLEYVGAVVVGPIFLMTALGVLASIQSHALVQRLLDLHVFGPLVIWGAQYLPFLLLCVVFTMMYKLVPHAEVRIGAAVTGGVVAALLWGIAGQAFAAFVAGSGRYSAIYSGLAILALFLLWLYASWLVFLIGAQVAFFLQHPDAYRPEYRWVHGAPSLREQASLRILLQLARRWIRGEGQQTLPELAAETDMPVPIVEELVDRLTSGGILISSGKPPRLALKTPPSTLEMSVLLKQMRDEGADPSQVGTRRDHAAETILVRRDHAVAQAFSGTTLETFALIEMKEDQKGEVGHTARQSGD